MTQIQIKLIAFIAWTAIVFAGAWLLNEYMEPDKPQVTIDQGELHDNPQNIDVYKMKIEELRSLLDCYANQKAYLELFMIDDTTMRAEAGLCKRKWYRDAEVHVRLQKNYVIGNITYPGGGMVSYYRRIGPVAIGGGGYFIEKSPGVMAGILYGF
jgi:hypothetical protein